jgi:streptomycin 6-kinase
MRAAPRPPKDAHQGALQLFLTRWRLTVDGTLIRTENSALLPVRRGPTLAMLKLALHEEEIRGNRLMSWWAGEGIAPVLAQADNALLLERADAEPALETLAGTGGDVEATLILCRAAARLHRREAPFHPQMIELRHWFRALEQAQAHGCAAVAAAATTARRLLDLQGDVVPLHGDIHHGNVLHFGAKKWLAIDPKGLIGEAAFDYVNILRNPDAAAAVDPARFEARVAIICRETGIPAERLIDWAISFFGLSAAWSMEEGDDCRTDLALLDLALRLRAAPAITR